jgi:hypothetical protein
MPQTQTLTEETVHRMAPDDKAVQTARDLVRKKPFKDLGISADGSWLLGQCQGTALYDISVDLANDAAPVGSCSCPSRKFPCKHALGLVLAYLDAPESFAAREPPAALLATREKQAQKPAEGKAAPRKVNKAARLKKAAAQRDGLDLLEKLLLDLVASGQWYERSRLDRLERQAKQLNDAYLPGPLVTLRRLVLLGNRKDIADEERAARGSDFIGHLWATVQKGRKYLDGKLNGGEPQAEAVTEEILGRAWQLTELREQGYIRQDLHLLELAYERVDDLARQERVETSHLLDLQDGAVYQAVAYRRFKGMNQIPGQASYTQPLAVSEAAVYPGFINRRVRWEPSAERSVPLETAHLRTAYAAATPVFEPLLASFRQQLRNPLAPRDAVVFLRCQAIGKVAGLIVLEDGTGNRLEAADRQADRANVANLVRAAGMLREPAVLARLFVQPLTNTIVAQPLAALTETDHLRLGL